MRVGGGSPAKAPPRQAPQRRRQHRSSPISRKRLEEHRESARLRQKYASVCISDRDTERLGQKDRERNRATETNRQADRDRDTGYRETDIDRDR